MTDDERLALLTDFIRRNSHVPDAVEALGLDDDMIAGGLVDSLMLLELVNYLEDQMGVTVAAEEIIYEHFGSLRSILAFIHVKQPGMAL